MDARIGKLIREGKEVFYAFIGNDRDYVEGSQDKIEVALGLRTESVAAVVVAEKHTKGPLVEYTVHVQPKFPAWDEVNGFDVTIWAYSKSEANKIARQNDWNDGVAFSGPVSYTATKKH